MSQQKVVTKNTDFPVIQAIVLFFMTLLTLLIGNKFMGNEFGIVMKWWLGMLGAGIAFLPLAFAVFNRFSDGGYVIAKALGIEVSSWLIWTLATAHIFKFTSLYAWITVFICGVLNYGLYFLYCGKKKKTPFAEMDGNKLLRMFYYELLFLLVFILFCYMKSFRVTIDNQTEKYMDFGFLASIMNSDYMPANDMWFSGEPINYYYYGIYVGGFLGKLARVSAGYAYNLDLMTICSLGFVQVYALVVEVIKLGIAEHDRRKAAKEQGFRGTKSQLAEFCCHIGGTIGGLAVFIAGNVHYIIYYVIFPMIGVEMPRPYHFPDSTRFISDEVGNKGGTLIHEFPCYSFILGDLHAHVTDITNVFLILSVLLGFLMARSQRMKNAREKGIFEKVDKNYLIKEALDPAIIIASFLIGIIRMTNSWDFPIYFVIAGGLLCFSNAIVTGFNKDTIKLTVLHAVECLVISTIVSLPFTLFFDSMTAGIGICPYHSSPYELAVLWALPISVCVGLYTVAIEKYRKDAGLTEEQRKQKGKKAVKLPELGYIRNNITEKVGSNDSKNAKAERVVTGTKVNHLFSFIFRQELSDLMILTLAICATGLVLMCELIYVKDIYGGTNVRTNTMFKLTYQAFMLYGVVMAYGITRFIAFGETKKQRRLSIVALCFLVWTFFYFGTACKMYVTTNYQSAGRTLDSYKTIRDAERGEAYLYLDGIYGEQYPDSIYGNVEVYPDRVFYSVESDERVNVLEDMIKWVNENTDPDAVIAQSPTRAYKPFATISAYTGRQAVVGWCFHEWLWRNGGTLDYPKEVTDRLNAMNVLYTTTEESVARDIIERYNIDYIYVGFTEGLNGYVFVEDGGSIPEGSNDYIYYRGSWYQPQIVNHEFLKSLGTVVYDAGNCKYEIYPAARNAGNTAWVADMSTTPLLSYDFRAYIVKVNR